MSKPTENETAYARLFSASGLMEANLIQSVLEAAGIPVLTFAESAAAVYGFTVGDMARVEIWVLRERLAEAEAILQELKTSDPAEGEEGEA